MEKPFSPEELKEIVELLIKFSGKTQHSVYADMLQMAAYTGMRAESLLKLKYSDVRQVEGRTLVEITEVKKGLPISAYLPSSAVELIERRRRDNPDDVYLFESKSNRSKGKPISRISAYRKFKEVGEVVQKNITFNSLRQQFLYMNISRSMDKSSDED